MRRNVIADTHATLTGTKIPYPFLVERPSFGKVRKTGFCLTRQPAYGDNTSIFICGILSVCAQPNETRNQDVTFTNESGENFIAGFVPVDVSCTFDGKAKQARLEPENLSKLQRQSSNVGLAILCPVGGLGTVLGTSAKGANREGDVYGFRKILISPE